MPRILFWSSGLNLHVATDAGGVGAELEQRLEHPKHFIPSRAPRAPRSRWQRGLPIPTGLLGHLLPRRSPWVSPWRVECALLVTEKCLSRYQRHRAGHFVVRCSAPAAGAPCLRQALLRSQPGFFGHRIFVLHHFLLPSPSSCALHAERLGGLRRTPFSRNFIDFPRSRPQLCGRDVDKTRSGSRWTSQPPCGKAARTSEPFTFSAQDFAQGTAPFQRWQKKSNSFGIKARRQRGASGQPGDSDCSPAQLQSLSPAGPGVPEPPRCHQPCA